MDEMKREQIVTAAKAYYPGNKEIVANPAVFMILDYLADDETPLACILSGISLQNKTRIGESGCLWVTDKRLVFTGLRSVFAKQPKIVEFSYPQIKDIEVGKGGLLGFGGQKVIVEYSSDRFVFLISESTNMIYDFVEQAKRLLHGEQPAEVPSEDRPDSAGDISAQLGRLTQLHDQGALTEEEFQAAKARVLRL